MNPGIIYHKRHTDIKKDTLHFLGCPENTAEYHATRLVTGILKTNKQTNRQKWKNATVLIEPMQGDCAHVIKIFFLDITILDSD